MKLQIYSSKQVVSSHYQFLKNYKYVIQQSYTPYECAYTIYNLNITVFNSPTDLEENI